MANTSTLEPTKPKRKTYPLPEKNQLVANRKRVLYPMANLFSAGAATPAMLGTGGELTDVDSESILGALIDATNDSVIVHVGVPDDMDVQETLWVRWLYTFANTASSAMSMNTKYVANVVTDYDGTATSATLTNTFVDLNDTTLTDAIDCDGGSTSYGIYRGGKGIISGGTFEQDGIISLQNLGTETGTATFYVLALELWYVQRKL